MFPSFDILPKKCKSSIMIHRVTVDLFVAEPSEILK